MLSPNRPGWENTNLEPLSPGKRFWSRAITNIPFIILGSAVPPASLSIEAVLALTTAPFLYLILFYWLFGGHIGHLLMGGRIRDARTGGRISFWQAVVRTSYDLAPLGVVLLVFWTIPMDAEIASGVLDGFIEIASTLAVSIPMGIMVLARESDHRHLFDLLSKTVVVDRATIPTTPDDATPRPARLAEAGKNLMAGVAAIAVLAGLAWLAGFGWFASTPAGEGEAESAPAVQRVLVPVEMETPVATAIPTLAAKSMPSRFQPGEKEYVHALVMEVMAEAMADRGEAPPTGDEYMVVCEALRKHRWDPSSFYADPDATTRLGMIVGGMDGMFAEMDKLRLERQWAAYILNDFCADIQPASGLGNPGGGRSVSLPAATTSPIPTPTAQTDSGRRETAATPSPGAALATSLARITTRQPEPTIIVPSPMPLPTDTPAPTPAPTATPIPRPSPTPTPTKHPAVPTPTRTAGSGMDSVNCGPNCSWDFAPAITSVEWIDPPTVSGSGRISLKVKIGDRDRMTFPNQPGGGSSNIALTNGLTTLYGSVIPPAPPGMTWNPAPGQWVADTYHLRDRIFTVSARIDSQAASQRDLTLCLWTGGWGSANRILACIPVARP